MPRARSASFIATHTPALRFGLNSLVAGALLLGISSVAMASSPVSVVNTNPSLEEVQNAQKAWCNALVQISQTHAKEGLPKAKELAGKVLDQAYGYNMGAVLFKPTLTSGEQTFRTTREGALAYFVGDNAKFPSDKGFALNNWQQCDVKNVAMHINGDLALTQGNVMIRGQNNQVTTVDKTWGFKRDDQGQLRIVLHHSSLPYSPAK